MACIFAHFKTVNGCNCFQSAEVKLVPLDQILLLLFTCLILVKDKRTAFVSKVSRIWPFQHKLQGVKRL